MRANLTLLSLLVLLLVGDVAAASASLDVRDLHRVSAHRDLFAAEILGSEVFAVGALGTLLWSGDGGVNWRDESVDTTLALLDVASSGAHTVAVGQLGIVVIHENDRWELHQAPTKERLMAVDVNASGLAVAVGSFGSLLVSEDGGRSWRAPTIDWFECNPVGEPHLYDVDIRDDDSVLVVGEFGMVLRSEDNGKSWQLIRDGDASLFALNGDTRRVFAAGQDGAVLRSLDGGLTWQSMETGVRANLLGIARDPESGALVASGMRTVIYSNDGGQSWRELTQDDFGRRWYGDAVWSEKAAGFVLLGSAGAIKLVGHLK